MAGVLSFTLGLEASKFLSGLGISSAGLLSFAGIAEGLGKVFEKTWSAIEQGGALKDLAGQLRESVGNTYSLQVAFRVAGAGSDQLAGTVNRLRKAIAGITDDGESTKDLFKSLGLDFAQIQAMDTPGRITAIAAALKGLGGDQAAGIAGKIFGREGASAILRISADLDGFKNALTATSAEAAVFQKNADVFDNIGDTLELITSKTKGFWAGIASGAAPVIQAFENFANYPAIVKFGETIGQGLAAVFQSFAAGEFTHLLALAFQAGGEQGINFLVAGFNGAVAVFAERLGQVFLEIPQLFGAMIASIGDLLTSKFKLTLADIASSAADVLSALGFTKAAGSASRAAGNLAQGAADAADAGMKRVHDGIADIFASTSADFVDLAQTFKDAFEASNGLLGNEKLNGLLALLKRLTPMLGGDASGAKSGPGKQDDAVGIGGKKLAPNALERIGFIFNGSSGATDPIVRELRVSNRTLVKIQESLNKTDFQNRITVTDPNYFMSLLKNILAPTDNASKLRHNTITHAKNDKLISEMKTQLVELRAERERIITEGDPNDAASVGRATDILTKLQMLERRIEQLQASNAELEKAMPAAMSQIRSFYPDALQKIVDEGIEELRRQIAPIVADTNWFVDGEFTGYNRGESVDIAALKDDLATRLYNSSTWARRVREFQIQGFDERADLNCAADQLEFADAAQALLNDWAKRK